MKNSLINQTRKCALMLCLLVPLYCGAEQFVELTVEIEINDWGYWFFEDGFARLGRPKTSIFVPSRTVRCVVGMNTWMMEGDFTRNGRQTYWFTGTNILNHTVITKETPDSDIERIFRASKLALRSPRVGESATRVFESADGNPCRPVRVLDSLDTLGNISWLAFCSGSFLKHDGRKIYPPFSIWKEIGPWPFTDKTEVFEDGLGLPRSVKLFKTNDQTNNQTVFQYQVHESTNVLGWSFPLEFYLAQYVPARTNGYEVRLTAKGRVTSIKEGAKPEIPAEVWKAVGK